MYRYLDRPLAQLDARAAFLVAAMREWVSTVQRQQCPCRATAFRFKAIGLEEVAGDFGMAMHTLNGEGLAPLRFGAPCRATVSDDEAKLLALFDAPVDNGPEIVQRLAAALVDQTAVTRLARAATVVAAHLAASHVSTKFD